MAEKQAIQSDEKKKPAVDDEEGENSKGNPVKLSKITEPVWQIFNKIPTFTNRSKDTRLAVVKSTRVKVAGLVESLKNYKHYFQSDELRINIKTVIASVQNMFADGTTKMFVHQMNKQIDGSTKLEFFCVAVRKYEIKGQDAVDFCLATYSYAKSVDQGLKKFGNGAITSGLIFGGLTLATGGIGGIIASGVMGVLGIGAKRIAEDTNINENFKNQIEASFIYELVSRGHAVVDGDRHIYITND